MKNGRRNLRGRRGERILSFMVWFSFRFTGLSAFFMFTASPDDSHAARRKYKKEVDKLKPDLEAYNKQKEAAMGLAPGTLSQSGSSTFSLDAFDPAAASSSQVTPLISPMPLTGTLNLCCQMVPTAYQQQVAAEGLYRDANSLLYADNKPTDEAIDRVIGKINQEYVAGLNTFPALH